jgi:probable F420-dependent oxidoreductase
MRVGLMLPNRWIDYLPSASELSDYFRRAEGAGFDSFWVTDRLLHDQVNMLHPFALLTHAAAATEHVRLGTAVYMLTMRDPTDVARQAMSIDYLSAGRFDFGVSLAAMDHEYKAMNLGTDHRVGRFEEQVALLRAFWRGESFDFHGRYYNFDQAAILPRPVRAGGIPLLFGAGSRSDAGLKRAGRLADGWIMGTPGEKPEDFKRAWSVVTEAARQAGRDPEALDNMKIIYVNVDDDPERGRRRIEQELDTYYGSARYPHAIVAGAPETIAEAVWAFADAGAREVALFLPWFEPDKLQGLAEVVRRIAAA